MDDPKPSPSPPQHAARRRILPLSGPSRILAIVVVCLLAVGPRPSRLTPAPNVVLISFDTLRADHLGCYGYARRAVSPEIDALAKDSVLFEQHITAAPWTTPSHMSLFTSRSPTGHGITQSMGVLRIFFKNHQPYPALSTAQPTLPELLSRDGFASAAFTGDAMVDPSFGFGRGFVFYDTSMEKVDQANMDRMGAWLRARGTRPFFLFWHTYEVHAPYQDTRYLSEVTTPEQAAGIANDLSALRGTRDAFAEVKILAAHKAFNREACTALYDGAVAASDRWLGELVRQLREAGLYDQTVIVFTSDHGEQLGERPSPPDAPGGGIHDTHGVSLYDELLRIPLLVKLPRQALGGRRVAALTREVDVMPTLLELLGIPPPTGIEGAPLQPFFGDGPPARERLAYSESLSIDEEKKSLRSARYKYILGIDPRFVASRGRSSIPKRPASRELYDLVADPLEQHNLLAQDPPEHLEALAQAMDAKLRAVNRAARSTDPLSQGTADPDVVERMRALGYVQ
jgi:arylsulfatase A-like enzyme